MYPDISEREAPPSNDRLVYNVPTTIYIRYNIFRKIYLDGRGQNKNFATKNHADLRHKNLIYEEKMGKRNSCTRPIGLADKNKKMKYRLTYDGSLIFLNTPEEAGYEPYPVRFYVLAQIIYDYGLEYVCVDNQGKTAYLPAIVDKKEMLESMKGRMSCVCSMNDGRVYAFVAPGEIISDVESVNINDMEEGDYVLHPLIGLFN